MFPGMFDVLRPSNLLPKVIEKIAVSLIVGVISLFFLWVVSKLPSTQGWIWPHYVLAFGAVLGVVVALVSFVLIAYRLFYPLPVQVAAEGAGAKVADIGRGELDALNSTLAQTAKDANSARHLAESIIIRERLVAYRLKLDEFAPRFDDMFDRALRHVAAWDGHSPLEIRVLDRLPNFNEEIMIPRSDLFPGKFGPLAYKQKDAPPPLIPVPGEPDGLSDRVKYEYRNVYALHKSIKDAIAADRSRIVSALQKHRAPGELFASYDEPGGITTTSRGTVLEPIGSP